MVGGSTGRGGGAEFAEQPESGLLEQRCRLHFEEARLRPPGFVAAEGVLLLGGDVAGVVVRHADQHRRLERAFRLDVQANLAEGLAGGGAERQVADAKRLHGSAEPRWPVGELHRFASVDVRKGAERSLRGTLQRLPRSRHLGGGGAAHVEFDRRFLGGEGQVIAVADAAPGVVNRARDRLGNGVHLMILVGLPQRPANVDVVDVAEAAIREHADERLPRVTALAAGLLVQQIRDDAEIVGRNVRRRITADVVEGVTRVNGEGLAVGVGRLLDREYRNIRVDGAGGADDALVESGRIGLYAVVGAGEGARDSAARSHDVAAIEDDAILAADRPADPGRLQTIDRDPDAIGDARGGPFEIGRVGIALEDLDGGDGAVRVRAADEDVALGNPGKAVNLMLDLAEPFLAGGDQVEHNEGQARRAVVEDETAREQVVVNVRRAAILHRAAQRHPEIRSDRRGRRAGPELLLVAHARVLGGLPSGYRTPRSPRVATRGLAGSDRSAQTCPGGL